MTHTSLLDELLESLDEHGGEDWYRRNARHFLEVCDLFGRYAAQHHDALVKRFIEQPAAKLSTGAHAGLTASGPPLPVLLRSLEVLRDMRMAAARTDMPSRHEDLGRLRRAVG
jgi:hypothetical protein